MYSEEILDLCAAKPNQGELKTKTHEADLDQPYCGDHIHVELEIENDKIKDVKYKNKKQCFVTVMAASVLTEKIKEMSVEEVLKLKKEDLDEMIGSKVIETRIRCELLPLEAIQEALRK